MYTTIVSRYIRKDGDIQVLRHSRHLREGLGRRHGAQDRLRLPALLGARRIVVGRDVRLSSGEIFAELSRGMTEAGCDVDDIGLCDTPAVYFATAFYHMDGSVMITASHNPPEYNGMKVSRKEAVPVGFDTGLADLERSLQGADDRSTGRRTGVIRPLDIRKDYLAHLGKFRSELDGLRVIIDCSNGMAGIYLRDALRGTGGDFRFMFEEPDGRFPNHPPNPLVEENLADLKRAVADQDARLGNLLRWGRRPRDVRR